MNSNGALLLCSCLVWYCCCPSSSSPRLLKRSNQNAANPNVIDYTGTRKAQTAIPLLLSEPLRVAFIGSKEFLNCLRRMWLKMNKGTLIRNLQAQKWQYEHWGNSSICGTSELFHYQHNKNLHNIHYISNH